MRLTALSVCGTLLAFFSLFWTTADSEEGDLLGNHEIGPCAATLRPEGPCGQGQDGSTCPYLFSLPPLTFHFPKQLRELEKIVEDLQELKDNVDQLRKMCADCTVSQTERECGRQRESEYYDVNEGTGRHKDERDWLNEREPEGVKNVSLRCRADGVKAEKSIERDADIDSEKRKNLEEKERNKWDAERGSDKIVVKDNEKEVAEEDGKTQTDEAKGKDKPGQPKVPASSENERPGDMGKKKVVDKYNRETMTDVSKDGEENSKPNPEGMLERGKERMITSNIKNKEKIEDSEHYVWRNETKETDKRTQTEEDRGSDGTKMSEGRNEHTNKEREQHREERRKEMEKGIKVERNNEKPKQTESIGRAEKERTIKEGAVEEDREMGKEIKTEGEKTVQSLQRDGDGDLESSKSTEGTDFVSISPTDSIISAAPRHDSMDLSEVVTITSPLPPPPVSSSTPHLITDVDQGKTITADRPTLSTGFQAGDISEQTSPDAEAGLRNTRRPPTAATISAEGGPRQRRPSITTWSTSKTRTWLGSSDQGWVKSTTTTTSTTTPHQSLNTTTSPGVSDHSRWAARRNTSSHAKTGVKPLPGQAPKPSGRIKPEADQRLKNPKIARKPDQGLLPDESIKSDQKKKLYQKPTTDQKSKTSKDPVWVHQQKPEQIPSSDNSPTDKNLPNFQIPKHDHENTTDGNQTPPQKTKTHPKSLSPVHRPTSDQRSGTENITGSHKDPLTDQDPPSVVQRTDHDLKPNKKLVHPIKTDKPDQKKKSHEEPENEEKPDQRSTSNPHFSPEEPERRETTSLTSNPHQKPLTKSTGSSDEDPLPGTRTIKDTAPGKTPDRSPVKPSNQRPRPSQKIPKINQKPKPGQASKPNPKNPKPVTGQKTKPNVKPKPDQTQTNPRLKTPQPDQMPNPDTKTLPEENKTSSPPRYRTPTRPTVESGETPAEMPKAAVQPKPSPQIKTDPPKISGAFTDGIQNSQTDLPPASGHEVPHSPADTKLKSKNQDYNIKTTTQGPKTSNSLKTEHFPHLTSHPEGFTMSPNSRITSDLRPKTASQPPSIEMTTRLNKIMRGILPSVVTSTGPESTKPNQASKTDSGPTPHPDKMLVPGPSPITQTTSTTTSDLRSTTPATSALEYPADESTTPSARELRVKINQVAAFLNNSLSPNKGPDRRPTEHPEDSSRSDRTDGKQPTLKQSKVNLVRRDCSDHLLRGGTKSGVYVVTPDLRGRSFPVFCDMEQEGGGWTLLQSRQDGSVSFNRSWAEYRVGFGEINRGEFWLGNNMIHLLTRDRDMVLRVELEDFNGVTEYAEYKHFRVANERMRYRLTVGGYSGTAGDALRFSKTYDHNNRAFTTPDRDHDRYPSGNCGAYYSSGWWFDACMAANLNGRYYVGKYKGVRDGIFWGTWHNISTEYYPTNDRQSFKTVRMMIRPKGFTTRAGL